MAKNWTVKEAAKVIAAGKNKEELMELGKRFPLATRNITGIGASCMATSLLNEFFNAMPDYLTMNKLNTSLKGDAVESEDSEEEMEDVEEVKEAKSEKKEAAKVEKKGATKDFSEMTAQEMYQFGKSKGIKFTSTKKADMLEVLEEKFGSGSAKKEEVVEDDDENDYASMSTKDLFKECKSRGLKAEIKKPAKYYIAILEKDDKAKADAAESDDEDWGEEEEESKKDAKKDSKKDSKKKEADEDEDWDI